jgi:hypothetical protein
MTHPKAAKGASPAFHQKNICKSYKNKQASNTSSSISMSIANNPTRKKNIHHGEEV